jgi:Animal haem peroxidase
MCHTWFGQRRQVREAAKPKLKTEIDRNAPINDPDILDFVELRNADGEVIPPDSEEAESDAVVAVRRTSVAARLRALYGDNPSQADAFVAMVAEAHVPGTEFGELQLAIWRRQFEALRDGDRFFYLNDPALGEIERRYGVSFRHTLGEIIEMNTGTDVQDNVFEVEPE